METLFASSRLSFSFSLSDVDLVQMKLTEERALLLLLFGEKKERDKLILLTQIKRKISKKKRKGKKTKKRKKKKGKSNLSKPYSRYQLAKGRGKMAQGRQKKRIAGKVDFRVGGEGATCKRASRRREGAS